MSYTNYPNGITSMGVPYPGGGGTLPMAQNYFYVCSVNGSNGNEGTSQDAPFATIDYAIGKCTADKGDVIVVMQNHAETLTAAGAIACDVAGVNIIGLGTGTDRPELTFSTSTGASVLITAANVQIANIVGISGIDGLTQPFDIRAAGCTIGNYANGLVEWQDPTSATQAVRQILTTAAADNLTVNLKVSGVISGGTSPVNSIRLVGCNGGVLNLDFYGRASTAVVEFITTACTNIEVYGYIYNSGVTNGTKDVVDTVTGSTWFAAINDGAAGNQYIGGSAAALAANSVAAVTNIQENVAFKAAATMVNAQTIFTIAGGPIQITALYSLCVTANDATASTLQYQSAPTVGSATTFSNASASLANAAAGASVSLIGTALTTQASLVASGANLSTTPGGIIVPAGTIKMVIGVGSTTGTWSHYIRYKPLATGVTVS